jgi:UDP-N-acetylmuramyl tripeptide synthase
MSSTQLQKQKVGRPSVITEDVVQKLEAALACGYSVNVACYYSGVSRSAFYEHKAMDRAFSDKMRLAEELSTHRARQVILQAIDKGDVKAAMYWLNRKARTEFAPPKSY